MAPMVIADSDDEDEFNYSPPPQSPQGSSFGASSAPGHVNHSESTDPAFFQHILDEQSAAARENKYGSDSRVMEGRGDPLPATGRRAGEDEAECSSITSTDPLQAGVEENLEKPKLREMKSMAGANGLHGRRGVADDPWEIPSSPDEEGTMGVQRPRSYEKKRGKRTESTKKSSKTTPDHLIQTSSSSYDEMEFRRSKKRKVDHELGPVQDVEEVDLVQKPASPESDYNPRRLSPETMPPPTLPIERSSFIVALKTRRQVNEPESGDEPSQDQGLSKPEAGAGLAQSSGSATNVNTPRSEPRSSRKVKGDSTENDTKESTNYDDDHGTGNWTLSSSDVITKKPEESIRQREKRQPDQQAQVILPETDEAELDDFSPVYGQKLAEDESEESDFAEPVPKIKKQRGRPKKTADPKAKPKAKASAADHETNEQQGTKPKKKRGRPRKKDQQAGGNEHHPPENGPSLEAGEFPATKAEDNAKTERRTSTASGKDAIPDKGEKPEVDESHIPVKVDVDKHQETETLENTVKQENSPEKQQEEKKTPLKPTKPTALDSKHNKPLYRVGLSKKSRIAPLLKIVRK